MCDDDRKRGLYDKYYVARVGDHNGKHDECRYFVLDLDHDIFSWPSLIAYARACQADFPELARSLRRMIIGSEVGRMAVAEDVAAQWEAMDRPGVGDAG